MDDKSLDIKAQLLNLLRNQGAWNAFSASPAEAVAQAARWGLRITEAQAVNMILVISSYLAKIDELHLTLLNTVVPGSILLQSMPQEVPRSDPTRGYASTGKVGNGPVPHLDAQVAPLLFRFDMPGFTLLALAHAFGMA